MFRTTTSQLLLRMALLFVLCSMSGLANAQEKPLSEEEAVKQFRAISKAGPFRADVGTVAEMQIPAGYRYVGKDKIAALNKLTGNRTSPGDVGALMPENIGWFIFFTYSDEGYVKDDEKDKLDAKALLESLQENQKEDNKARVQEKLTPLTLLGWEKPPFFDSNTKNLTWAIKLQAQGQADYTVNYESRVLGRSGYMSCTLVISPDQLDSTIPVYDKLLTSFNYKSGQKYSEWKPGDKVAAIGLAALVGGGAVALAAKSGFLAKFIKPIIIGVVAFFGAIAAFFKKLFGFGKKETPQE